MSKLLLTLVLSLSAVCMHAQTNFDIIYLKDGSIYRGHITEFIPNSRATIKLLDDRIIEVPADQIMQMTVGTDQVIRKQFDIKEKGYFHNSLLGINLGNGGDNTTPVTFAYNMVNGYRIKNHHLGLGLGVEKHVGNWYAPIYADYSFHFLKGRTSPVLGINGGFMVPMPNEFHDANDYTNGSFIGGRLGFVAYSNPHFALLVNLTYRYINFSGSEYMNFPRWGDSLWPDSYILTGSAELHRVGIMLGFVIN